MMAVEGEMRSCRGRAARLCVWTGISSLARCGWVAGREQCGAIPCRPSPLTRFLSSRKKFYYPFLAL